MEGFRIRVSEPLLPPLEDLIPLMEEIWRSRRVTSGRFVEELERSLRDILEVKCVKLVPSGTLALTMLLKALIYLGYLKEGAKVALPDYSFIATLNAVYWAGLEPILVDVDEETFLIGPKELESLSRGDVEAVIAVDLFGNPVDYAVLEGAMRDMWGERVVLLSDSAEAFGARYLGKPLGGQALAHAFSFSPSKLLTGMELGAISTDNEELCETIGKLCKHGDAFCGFNCRVTEVSAATLLLSLGSLEEVLRKRRRQVELYRGWLEPLGFRFQRVTPGAEHSWTYLAVLLPADLPDYKSLSVESVVERLRDEGVEVKRYFRPLHAMLGVEEGVFVRSESLYRRALTLPLGPHLREEDIEHVCSLLAGLVR